MVHPEARTSALHQALRRGTAEILTRSKLPIEVIHNPAMERKLHELMKADYGIIEITNHWGLMEFPSVLEFNYQNPDLRRARTLLPFTAYQYKHWMAYVGKYGLDTPLAKTATRDSDEYYEKHPEEKPEDYADLNKQFVRQAARTLKPGGLLLFSPQGKRQDKVPERFQDNMMATLLLGLQAEQVNFDKLAFLFVGTGLKGIDDYEPWHDTKWTMPHPPVEVKVGNVITFNESKLAGYIRKKADRWSRANLAEVVSPAQLASPTLIKL